MTTAKFTALGLPFTLPGGASGVDSVFTADALVGVVLTKITEKTTASFDFTTTLDDVAADVDADGRLWEVGYRLADGTTGTVSPKDAATFEAWDVSDLYGLAAPPHVVQFVWRGIPIPLATGYDRIAVTLQVRQDTNDKLTRWYVTVTKENGSSASIEHIDAPILWVKGPALPVGVESHLVGQKRTRVLVPASIHARMPAHAPNTDLWTWATNGYVTDDGEAFRSRHPNPGQPLQFAAVGSMNNDGGAPDPGYRKFLYFGTEDAAGWIKDYRYKGLSRATGTEAWVRLSVRHYPEFRHLGGADNSGGRESECTWPYATVTGALKVQTDHFWWDICDLYRQRMIAIGAVPPVIESNARLASKINRQPTLFVPTIMVGFWSSISGSTLYEKLYRYYRTLAFALSNPHVNPANGYLHLQSWLLGGLGVTNPGNPIRTHPTHRADDGLAEMLAAAFADGVRVSGYSRAWELPDERGWRPLSPIFDRDGTQAVDPTLGKKYDPGATEYGTWWARNVASQMRELGFRGEYIDSLGGNTPALSYPPALEHRQHGGHYGRDGKLHLVDSVRTVFGDTDGMLGTEAAEELFSYAMDVVQEHYIWYPWHMDLAESTVRGVGAVTHLPIEARLMSPPLWMAVWHEYSPAQHVGLPFTNAPLGTNADWFPSGGATGLSAAELRDVWAFLQAAIFTNGSRSGFVSVQEDFDRSDANVQAWSGVSNALALLGEGERSLIVNTTKDPSQVGITVCAWLRDLFAAQLRAHAGQFTMFGRLLRPLVVDPAVAGTSTNPISVLSDAKVNWSGSSGNRIWGMLPTLYTPVTGIPAAQFLWALDAGFSVFDVLHSMWRSPEGLAGLVLVNWTNANATWFGTLDASLYADIPATFDVVKLTLGGAPSTLATGLSGTISLGNTGVPTVALGTLAPRSITVLTFPAT